MKLAYFTKVSIISWQVWVAALALALVALAAFHNSFSGPFVFDDTLSIPANPSIRQFGTALSPPGGSGETVSGRPLLNLSFAVNYAISGGATWSYHVGNLLIHIAAGLVLFGLVRRTLLLPALRGRFGGAALPVAFVAAAIWLAHPLQTGAVTYIAQRAESLMALLYLLTLYCFVRSMERTDQTDLTDRTNRSKVFLVLSVLCCLLGMAAKEVMVSAPLMVLLFDRALVAGSFREAWGRRRGYYVSLAATLLLLLWLVVQNGNRGDTAGFGIGTSAYVADVSAWTYLLTQAKAIMLYIGLAVWPRGQVFDYGTAVVTSAGAVWLQGLCVLALAGGALWLLARRPAAGLLAFFFFAVLAPASSFIPVASEPVAEHRMYLPLAALAVAAALASWHWFGRGSNRNKIIWGGAGVAVVCGLAVATVQRNRVYGDAALLWRDTVEKVPGNARANNNYANALTGDTDTCAEAIRYCQRAIDLNPDYEPAYNNYGYALAKLGRNDEALGYYNKALGFGRRLGLEVTLCNRATALTRLGRTVEAESDFKASLALAPDNTEALNNYGNLLCTLGRSREAIECFDRALAIEPDYASAWSNRGNVFSAQGLDRDEALRCYKRAAALDPEALGGAGQRRALLHGAQFARGGGRVFSRGARRESAGRSRLALPSRQRAHALRRRGGEYSRV